MYNVVYRVTDLIDNMEARVYERADYYEVALVDLDTGRRVPHGRIFYDFTEGRSIALTKAAEVANRWCAPYPLNSEEV